MKKFLSVMTALVLSSCATMTDQDGGLTEDHATTVSGCGVGNYTFRHLKGQCGNQEKPVAAVTEVPDSAPKAPPAAPPVVVERASAKLVDNKIEISQEVKFQSGKSVILGVSRPVLDDVSAVIIGNKEKISTVTVEGHTDHIGSGPKNEALSQRRANAVRAYLVKKGVDGKMVTAKGYGSSKPKFDPSTASKDEWAQNRRVEFTAEMK